MGCLVEGKEGDGEEAWKEEGGDCTAGSSKTEDRAGAVLEVECRVLGLRCSFTVCP